MAGYSTRVITSLPDRSTTPSADPRTAQPVAAAVESDHRSGSRLRSPAIMKILLHASSFAPHQGGVEELCDQLARQLRSLGHEVSILTMRWPRDLPAHESVNATPVTRIHFRSTDGGVARRAAATLTVPFTLARTLVTLRRIRPDVVHTQCVSSAAWFVHLAARLLRIPVVTTLQGELTMDATGVYERSPMTRAALRRAMRYSAAVTACSQATLAEAERWAGVDLGERGSVIHNGVRTADFADVSPPAVSSRSPYVLAVARLVPQKGIDVLLEAERIRCSAGPITHRLVIAGDGTERERLEGLAAELGLADHVEFLGGQDRTAIAAWFAGASAFVLPSRHEPFGIVVLEAMASRTPVVATRVGGVPEFAVDGVNALLVDGDDPSAMAAAVGRILADDALADELASAGARTAADHDWSSITRRYEAVYDEVLTRSRGERPRRRHRTT
jgi:glycogen(starch) synthase